jgi:hypothetical protein
VDRAAAQIATLPKKKQDEVVAGGKDQIVQAAKEVRRKNRGESPVPAPADRKKSISPDKLAQLQDLVVRLEELASVPQMQISPIHIRRCVARMKELLF